MRTAAAEARLAARAWPARAAASRTSRPACHWTRRPAPAARAPPTAPCMRRCGRLQGGKGGAEGRFERAGLNRAWGRERTRCGQRQ
eukprot:324159-Chlamydomonas_euryale.AAC.1